MRFGIDTPDFPDSGCAIVFGGSGGLGMASAGLMAKLPVQKQPARLYTMEEYLQGIHLRKCNDDEPQT